MQKMISTVDTWIENNGGYYDEKGCIAKFVEEFNEAIEALNNGTKVDIGFELADTLFSIICLAKVKDINLEKAF